MLRGEIEILRKAYAIEVILFGMREEEKEDNKSISEVFGLATEEKEKEEEYEEDWRSQEAKEEIILYSEDEGGKNE